jgi:hypothetical protein
MCVYNHEALLDALLASPQDCSWARLYLQRLVQGHFNAAPGLLASVAEINVVDQTAWASVSVCRNTGLGKPECSRRAELTP